MITTVAGIVALDILFVVANARVFRRLHDRDEEILRMMNGDMLLAAEIPYKKTGS